MDRRKLVIGHLTGQDQHTMNVHIIQMLVIFVCMVLGDPMIG